MPRKKPQQARSKATVEAIVEATGQVFEQRGFEKTTSTRVAERAGVSVGSLYQYFPDKRALIAAFFERRLAQDVELMHALLRRGPPASASALVRAATEEMVRLYREERALYVGVVEVLPLMEQIDEVRAGLDRAVELAASVLAGFPDVVRDRDPRLLALVSFHGLRSALNAVVANAPEKLDDPSLGPMLTGGVLGFLGIADEP